MGDQFRPRIESICREKKIIAYLTDTRRMKVRIVKALTEIQLEVEDVGVCPCSHRYVDPFAPSVFRYCLLWLITCITKTQPQRNRFPAVPFLTQVNVENIRYWDRIHSSRTNREKPDSLYENRGTSNLSRGHLSPRSFVYRNTS